MARPVLDPDLMTLRSDLDTDPTPVRSTGESNERPTPSGHLLPEERARIDEMLAESRQRSAWRRQRAAAHEHEAPLLHSPPRGERASDMHMIGDFHGVFTCESPGTGTELQATGTALSGIPSS